MKKVNTGAKIKGTIQAIAFDKFGNEIWKEKTDNLITNEALDDILDVYLSDGSADATHYVGLKGAGGEAAGDTLGSHGGWSEVTEYSGDRKEWSEGGVSSQSIDNSGSTASFSITGSCTIAGAFLASTTDNTGVLVGVGDFDTSRSLGDGDTLNVQYTISAADDGS